MALIKQSELQQTLKDFSYIERLAKDRQEGISTSEEFEDLIISIFHRRKIHQDHKGGTDSIDTGTMLF